MFAALIILISTRNDELYKLYTTLAVLAFLTGLSFPLTCSCARKRYSPAMVSFFMALPVLMFCFWLILSYKVHATTPIVWKYAIEILALCFAAVAFYYTAGYAFGRVKVKTTLVAAMMGAFMCIMTISDSRSFGLELLFVGSAGMLLLETWMIVNNSAEPTDEENGEPAEKAPAEEKTEPLEKGKTVINAGGRVEPMNEPTVRAPKAKVKNDVVDEILNEYHNS